MANTWNKADTTWGYNSWESDTVTVSLTGVSSTSSLGTLAYAGNIAGWGRDAWGDNDWGENTSTISLTGLSLTTSLGDVLAYPESGWGRDTWGFENWGENATTISLTGLELTTALGTLTYAGATDGWGRNA